MKTPMRSGGSQVVPTPSRRRPAGDPPWLGERADLSLDAIKGHFDERVSPVGITSAPRSDERVSAVMGLLADGPHGAEILLTRRSKSLTNHRGEISFPGGRVDEGESIVDAALRETWEEVGIPSHLVHVHSELSPLSTFVSRSYIVPVVASIDRKVDVRPNPEEVDRAFWIPLRELVREDTYAGELWTFDSAADPRERSMHFFYLDDETVWGATARMLHEILCIVHRVRP